MWVRWDHVQAEIKKLEVRAEVDWDRNSDLTAEVKRLRDKVGVLEVERRWANDAKREALADLDRRDAEIAELNAAILKLDDQLNVMARDRNLWRDRCRSAERLLEDLVVGLAISLDDERLRWVECQIERADLDAIRAHLAQHCAEETAGG